MKLFLLTQTENEGYDTFDSSIVAAVNEEEAKKIHPTDDYQISAPPNMWRSNCWASSPTRVTAEYIGTAKPGTKAGSVICASFNAG